MAPTVDINNNEPVKEEVEISNLPVLFAKGYPTSLERMNVEQLELFIPFLMKCSQNNNLRPVWWPQNLPYKVPFEKPFETKKVKFLYKPRLHRV